MDCKRSLNVIADQAFNADHFNIKVGVKMRIRLTRVITILVVLLNIVALFFISKLIIGLRKDDNGDIANQLKVKKSCQHFSLPNFPIFCEKAMYCIRQSTDAFFFLNKKRGSSKLGGFQGFLKISLQSVFWPVYSAHEVLMCFYFYFIIFLVKTKWEHKKRANSQKTDES